jgi:hypothetical protein
LNDHVIPVVDPRGFLTPEEFHKLEDAPHTDVAAGEMEGAALK